MIPVWLTGNLITLLVGFAKTGVPGMGILAVVLMANLMDQTRLSVGVLLPLLITADVVAVATYHHHARWDLIRRLMPWVLGGVGLGTWALSHVQGSAFDLLLGGLVLGLLILDQCRIRMGWTDMPRHPLFGAVLGITTGFATTIGNVAGPVMTLYLLSQGLDKHRFMGSMAWFFLLLNCLKVPVFAFQGMITADTLLMDLTCVPGVLIGAWAGRRIFHHIPQKQFNVLVIVLAALSALRLML